MFKPKTPISGRLGNSSGAWIRTKDLRVMSPTSCHCSTPRYLWISDYSMRLIFGQGLVEKNSSHQIWNRFSGSGVEVVNSKVTSGVPSNGTIATRLSPSRIHLRSL